MKRQLFAFLITGIYLLAAGCSPTWEPSDPEAIGLVKSYFLYTHRGKSVEVEMTGRGKFNRDCKCFPIEFELTEKGKGPYRKTYYFFRNRAGKVEVKEYMSDTGD